MVFKEVSYAQNAFNKKKTYSELELQIKIVIIILTYLS